MKGNMLPSPSSTESMLSKFDWLGSAAFAHMVARQIVLSDWLDAFLVARVNKNWFRELRKHIKNSMVRSISAGSPELGMMLQRVNDEVGAEGVINTIFNIIQLEALRGRWKHGIDEELLQAAQPGFVGALRRLTGNLRHNAVDTAVVGQLRSGRLCFLCLGHAADPCVGTLLLVDIETPREGQYPW